MVILTGGVGTVAAQPDAIHQPVNDTLSVEADGLIDSGGIVESEVTAGSAKEQNSSTAGFESDDNTEFVESASFDTDTGTYSVSETRSNVELDQELRRVPAQKGIYEARHQYNFPDHLSRYEVSLPEASTVIDQHGFVPTNDDQIHRWDGSTPSPEIRYRLQANRSIDQEGPIAGPGRLLFADVGEWSVVQQPNIGHTWRWTTGPRIGLDCTVTARQGAVGDVLAYLGEHETFTHQAHGQEFQLIVPERAELAESPDEIFASLADASGTLRVGERDEEVFMIATPTKRIDWGVRGLQTGPADIWTRDIERLNTPDNVWLHEYIHSRQEYSSRPSLQWFSEGSATYYAALITHEQERISFEQFRDRLAVGTDQHRFRGSILNDPATWRSNANYHVGALVSGELDRQLRSATDRTGSLQEVFRQLNANTDVVTAEDFSTIMRDVGGKPVADESDRFTATTDRPAMWTVATHQESFGDPLDPARITFSLVEASDAVTVAGPFRNRSLDIRDTVQLVTDETLSFDVRATNYGDVAGEYDARFSVNGDLEQTQSGTLDPVESATLQFNHSFDSTGEFVLSVGDVDLFVSVTEPAAATIDSLSASETEIQAGERIELTATVRNDEFRPAKTTVEFTQNAHAFSSKTVHLDVGDDRTVSVERQLDEPGTYVFGLGDASPETLIVTVTEPATHGGDSDTSDPDDTEGDGAVDDDGSGFGVAVALIALASIGFCGRRVMIRMSN